MCGIVGILSKSGRNITRLRQCLEIMNRLQKHRGPDDEGVWLHPLSHVGFAHCRLSIIDLASGAQPMTDTHGNWITYNGEIYNYIELRKELCAERFRTQSDTEVILHAYKRWGTDCVRRFRGMFAFALWDEKKQVLFCARDRFGIKPLYYAENQDIFLFSSEIKSMLPFVKNIAMNIEALKEYFTFQFYLRGKTLFQDIHEVLPGHILTVEYGKVSLKKYWDVYYELDQTQTEAIAVDRLRDLLHESVDLHLRSDVPIGGYISGGLDSSVIGVLACRKKNHDYLGFNGKFDLGPEFDESVYAQMLGKHAGFQVHECLISAEDFIENISKVIYHLDFPVAGPGSFSQYMVSGLASKYRKVVLGGQGGDEIFGGYVRYLIAYFEQCIKSAIEGTMHKGKFIVTYESIIPNLSALRNYKPLLQEFWREGLFEPMDHRYFQLINRAKKFGSAIRWEDLGRYSPYETFKTIFNSNNVGKTAYFDLMTHFDFKTLLPALLQVEDRVSMAHGLESRVPLLDHYLIEYVATLPATVKFKNGNMKSIFKKAFCNLLPEKICARNDKMGFPTPFTEWICSDLRDFIIDIFSSQKAKERGFVDNRLVVEQMNRESRFGRNIWGLFCLELWQQEFLDKAFEYMKMGKELDG